MAYKNPDNRREKVIKVRLNTHEAQRLDDLLSRTGEQEAVLARKLLLHRLEEIMAEECVAKKVAS